MTVSDLYGLPVGMVWGETAKTLMGESRALPLAGGPAAFMGVRFLGRSESAFAPSVRQHDFGAVADLVKSRDSQIKNMLSCLTAPRARHWSEGGEKQGGVSGEWNRPRLMGILNVTPDSFSDGGEYLALNRAVSAARKMCEQGADMIDVGGESTRPGARPVSREEEARRIFPVLEALQKEVIAFSVDTRKAAIMQGAIDRGAKWINDVSALTYDRESLSVVASHDIPVILMHSAGGGGDATPDMSDNPVDVNVCLNVYDALSQCISRCVKAGISRDRIMIDPGIGFGKTFEGNLELIRNIALFHGLGVPILVGVSRKRFIGEITGQTAAGQRDTGSVAVALRLAQQGIQWIRVHNVAKTKQSLDIYFA